ncbi:beta-L-arabinofuranosidase domain-containing protein [Lachnospiraceae bacterium 29-84]
MMEKLRIADLNKIKIDDSFWNRYISLVKDVIIPYQWDVINDKVEGIEKSHSLMNFKIAAGREKGRFYGVVFQDTDVAKWLEAVAFSLASDPDQELMAQADEVIDIIGEAQQEDGYINTYFTIKEPGLRWTNLEEGHELYTAGHLMEAAVAYYKATGKRKFLDMICKFADLICEEFSEEKNGRGYPGHQEVEIGLIKLYEATGEERYIRQAKLFLDRRGVGENYFLWEEKQPKFKRIFPEFEGYLPLYSQSHKPVREQRTAEGHAVRAVYMYCAMADVAWKYQDKELLNVCEELWDNITKRRMYITGSIGSSGLLERFTTDYDLPNDSNYSETCASIGLALFGRRMAQITRDAKYVDVVERALYNTLLSGIAMDGKRFFYVNPLEVWPENCLPRTSKEHIKPVRQKWFGVACCPPNIARTLASLGEYIYFQDEGCLWLNLFISNKTEVALAGETVRVEVETRFPYDGKVRIHLESGNPIHGRLAVRIPEYAEGFTLYLDGAHIQEAVVEKGYAMLTLDQAEHLVELTFPLEPRMVHANPMVREDIGKVSILKGPVVYCAEETDNGGNLPAYYISGGAKLMEEYREDILGGTAVIRVEAKKAAGSWDGDQLYGEQGVSFEECMLTFVPYAYWGNRETGEMLVWIKELF